MSHDSEMAKKLTAAFPVLRRGYVTGDGDESVRSAVWLLGQQSSCANEPLDALTHYIEKGPKMAEFADSPELKEKILKVAKHASELRAALDAVSDRSPAPSELTGDQIDEVFKRYLAPRVAFRAYRIVDQCMTNLSTDPIPFAEGMDAMAEALKDGTKIATILGESSVGRDFAAMAERLADTAMYFRDFDKRYLPMFEDSKNEPLTDAEHEADERTLKRTRVE